MKMSLAFDEHRQSPHHRPPLAWRVVDALGRRMAAYAPSRRAVPPGRSTEAALNWLLQMADSSRLAESYPERRHEASGRACPALTGATLSTLWAFGQRSEAARLLEKLIHLQRPDGGFAPAGQAASSLLTTAHAATGLASLAGELSASQSALQRAAEWLAARIDRQGNIVACGDAPSPDRWATPLERLVCLPPLVQAARLCNQMEWATAARRAMHRAARQIDWLHAAAGGWRGLDGIGAAWQLGSTEEVNQALRLPGAMQCGDGTVPQSLDARWSCGPALARLAALWYRTNNRRAADRALAALGRQQRADGSLVGSWKRGAAYYPRRASTWAAITFLDAALLQVQFAFAGEDSHPSSDALPHADGRLQAVLNCCRELPPGAVVADVGCGEGRYLRAIAEHCPRLKLIGVDASPAMLEQLPPGIEQRTGSMLRLPLANASCDLVVAVESLEHALVPNTAVAELCRVVRSGGTVLIVDKHCDRQPLSHHEPWERWLEPNELQAWLAPHCEAVHVQPIAHGAPPRQGLFLACRATRAAAAYIRAA